MKLLITDFEDELRELAETATEIKVLIAFLTEEGLRWLPEEKMPVSDFIVGVDLGITSPDALRTLQSGGAEVRVFQEPGRLFHPKAIYLKTEDAEHLIVGSNNLTASGISSNHELATISVRNSYSEEVFSDFLDHFDFLKAHRACSPIDAQFFENYEPSRIQNNLAAELSSQVPLAGQPELAQPSSIDPSHGAALGRYLRLLSEMYPDVDRRKGQKKKNHPLVRLNNQEFRPTFDRIIAEASNGRLQAHSQLNQGGNWYTIPNILGWDESREPHERHRQDGGLRLQIHFSEDYRTVFLSLTIEYYLPNSSADNSAPVQVSRRHDRVLNHLEGFHPRAEENLPVFFHWKYEKDNLWSKPLISFRHEIATMPEEGVLLSEIEKLSDALNGAMLIG